MKTEITKDRITYLGKSFNELSNSEKDDLILYLTINYPEYKDIYLEKFKETRLGI